MKKKRKQETYQKKKNPTHKLMEKKKAEFQKKFYFCFIYYAKAFDCADHNKLSKTLTEMLIPDTLPAS